MPLARSRDYLSIGEVLDGLQEDFPDISISKIRFLESEGLITPERTPSGYRKFYEPDVTRLRFILILQRDQFMPLKIIRERLYEIDSNGGGMIPPGLDGGQGAGGSAKGAGSGPDMTGVQLSRADLMKAAELTEAQLAGLEDFDIIDGGGPYDEADLAVARAARRFFQYGVEPRHLRMYRQFADREASFFEQIVLPVVKKRDPEGQRQAARSMQELLGLARQLHEGALKARTRSLM